VTLTNRDVFVQDPTARDIPNLGVVKVRNPEDQGDWETLEWELASFVCEGAYHQGLERVLSQFLSHLSQAEQPAVWVSGFYGSGKSHLVRVLEYLWRDIEFPSKVSARELTSLPEDIKAHLTELSIAAKRHGGLWSAAGTLGAGAAGSVRLAFLRVIFDAAGLPDQYAPARLALWLKEEGHYDTVKAAVDASAKNGFKGALSNLYVDKHLAQALIDVGAGFGATTAEVSKALQAQFANKADISNDEMLDVFEAVLKLRATDGKIPLTLVVLDEMQQYINEDGKTAELVQFIVEGCSARFGSRVLVVATGQAALTATPTLSKLTDRFSVQIALSDTDVERVVRKVVLEKKPDKVADVKSVLDGESGEISRHLAGTHLAPVGADATTIVADYPLLPTRRRFWEATLRAIDKAGKSGVLRTQLRIVHEAAQTVADRPIGTVIGGDFVFDSQAAGMVQTGVLLKEIDETIRSLKQAGTVDGELKSRACALIFLISQLEKDGVGDTGIRATAATIADLMVEDLAADGARLRKEVPDLLEDLVQQGKVIKIQDEYLLQTAEGAEWTQFFNQRKAALKNDASRKSTLRNEWLQKVVDAELSGLSLRHGNSKVPRKVRQHWGDDDPAVKDAIPVWIRDGWNTTESKVKEAAAKAGVDSPTVFVLLPKIDADAIEDALIEHQAAVDTVGQKHEPQTGEGKQAKQGMQSRARASEDRLQSLFKGVVDRARVFQGGGNELTVTSLKATVLTAAEHALARKFPKFGAADHADWSKVGQRARDGAPDALAAVGHSGDVLAHPVCKEVLSRVSAAGTKGSDLRADLGGGEFGWPDDAVDGALYVLLGNGHIRAQQDGTTLAGPKQLLATQIGKTTFYKEDDPPTVPERLAVRGLLKAADVDYTDGQEGASTGALLQRLKDLAARAGGSAPLPEPPDTAHIDALLALAGNQQVKAIAAARNQLRSDLDSWSAVAKDRDQRLAAWQNLDRLLRHAADLPIAAEVEPDRVAVESGRLLMQAPDPVAPIVKKVADALRSALSSAVSEVNDDVTKAVADLQADADWSKLADGDRAQILAISNLAEVAAPTVSTDDELLRALDHTSLTGWSERRQLVAARLSDARIALARKLEPTSVEVDLPKATIRTAQEAEAYLAKLKAQLDEHLANGATIVVK